MNPAAAAANAAVRKSHALATPGEDGEACARCGGAGSRGGAASSRIASAVLISPPSVASSCFGHACTPHVEEAFARIVRAHGGAALVRGARRRGGGGRGRLA